MLVESRTMSSGTMQLFLVERDDRILQPQFWVRCKTLCVDLLLVHIDFSYTKVSLWYIYHNLCCSALMCSVLFWEIQNINTIFHSTQYMILTIVHCQISTQNGAWGNCLVDVIYTVSGIISVHHELSQIYFICPRSLTLLGQVVPWWQLVCGIEFSGLCCTSDFWCPVVLVKLRMGEQVVAELVSPIFTANNTFLHYCDW